MILDIQDIINSVSVPALIKDEFIKRGTFARLKNGDIQACVGGFSIVFPVEVSGEKWAFRCWHHTLDEAQARIKLLSAELNKSGLPYFVNFVYEDHGLTVGGVTYPTTRMKWINGRDIKDYICRHKFDRHKLFELASAFYSMTLDLHKASIAHGDLQHENIIVNPYGRIFLIDYDSMYVPALSYFNSKNTTNGKDGYQHPAREHCVYASPKLDYFSEVVILICILAIAHDPHLVEKYALEDSDSMLFRKSDFTHFSTSQVFKELSSLDEVFCVLLQVLSSYLKKSNIDDLEPLEVAINKACPTNAISIGAYLKEAEEKLKHKEAENERQKDVNAWRVACRWNTFSSYTNYINAFPDGVYIIEAQKRAFQRRKEEEAAKAEADRLAAIQEEEKRWNEACHQHTARSYQFFVQKYPSSKYKEEALVKLQECIEEESWTKAKYSNSISELERFVNKYPNSVHVQEAKRLKDKLLSIQEEERIWNAAFQANTKASYQNYLNRYPNGQFSHSAKQRIENLKSHSSGAGFWVFLILALIIGFVVYISNNQPYTAPTEPTPPKKVEQPYQPSTPKITESELNNLESKTEGLIKAMEIAKRTGDVRDANAYNQARKNLDLLKQYASSRYSDLKKRYDAL